MDITTQAKNHLEQAYNYYEEAEAFEKALEECETAIELDPYLADAHNLRGVLLEELGRPLDALGAYKKALQLDPDFVEAEENLSTLKAEFAAYNNLVTIATFSHPPEAYIPKTKLEAEGIWAFVADGDTVTANWLYSNAIGGVKLRVKAEDVERALEILEQEAEPIEWGEEEFDESDEDEKCPECGSLNTGYERYAMRWIFLSWLILQFPLPFFKRKWKCQDCGHTWKAGDFQNDTGDL
jgi:tetratricopeptide (TPR) repeat protein